jgi:hypothetical protein
MQQKSWNGPWEGAIENRLFWLTKLTPHPRIERGGQGSLRGGTLLLAGLGRGRPLLGRHTPGYWGLVTHVGAARGRYAAHTVGPGAARWLGAGGVGRVHRPLLPQPLVCLARAEIQCVEREVYGVFKSVIIGAFVWLRCSDWFTNEIKCILLIIVYLRLCCVLTRRGGGG